MTGEWREKRCPKCKERTLEEKKDLTKGTWTFTCGSCGYQANSLNHNIFLDEIPFYSLREEEDTALLFWFHPTGLTNSIIIEHIAKNKLLSKGEIAMEDLLNLISKLKRIQEESKITISKDGG